MSLSTNNRELPSCRMLVTQTHTMITVIIVVFTISLGLRMTTYLLAEPSSIINFLLVLNFLRDVSARVGGGGKCRSHMPRIYESNHDGTLPRSRQPNRKVSETPRISSRESGHDEQLPRFSRLRRKISAPIGIRQTRIRRRLTLVRKTLRDDAEVAIQREQRPKVTTSENPSKHPSKKSSRPAEITEQKSISQSIIKNNSTMSDTTESTSLPFTPMAPVYHFRMPRPGEAGALFFDKTNVTEFLKRWEEECDEVGYTDAQKCIKLP